MKSPLDNVKKIIEGKDLDAKESEIAKECMVELCHLCNVQKRLSKLDDLFDNLTDAVIVYDLDGNMVDANKQGKVILSNFDSFLHHKKAYSLAEIAMLENISPSGSVKTICVEAFNHQGKKNNFNISTSLTYNEFSQASGICLVINDVTEVQKQARQLEDMMASFTHDLKTPLIAAEINVDHLLKKDYGELNPQQEKVLSLLLESNSKALRLVKNLLRIFKYETSSHKLLLKSHNVIELINNTIRAIEPLLEEKNISISSDFKDTADLKLICDGFEIERVITNLLSNSIKYSNKGTKITIKAESKNGHIYISIIDQGIGIPEDKMEVLFDRFWQSKVYNSDTNGTGLGLYLSRQIIEAHGGVIWAKSDQGFGTEVNFKLPQEQE